GRRGRYRPLIAGHLSLVTRPLFAVRSCRSCPSSPEGKSGANPLVLLKIVSVASRFILPGERHGREAISCEAPEEDGGVGCWPERPRSCARPVSTNTFICPAVICLRRRPRSMREPRGCCPRRPPGRRRNNFLPRSRSPNRKRRLSPSRRKNRL